MAKIACDICGGSLSIDPSGEFAVCDSCGMKHTKDRVKAMAQEVTGTVAVSNIAGVDANMTRGWDILSGRSDGGSSKDYFDKALDIDPRNARAYVGKLCIEIDSANRDLRDCSNDFFTYNVKKEADLARHYEPLDGMLNYQNALRCADGTYREILRGYNSEIIENIDKLRTKFKFYVIVITSFIHSYAEGEYEWVGGKHPEMRPRRLGLLLDSSKVIVGKFRKDMRVRMLRTGSDWIIKYRYDSNDYYISPLVGKFKEKVGEFNEDKICCGDVFVLNSEIEEEYRKLDEARKIEQERKAEQERIEREEERRIEQEIEKHRKIEDEKRKKKRRLCVVLLTVLGVISAGVIFALPKTSMLGYGGAAMRKLFMYGGIIAGINIVFRFLEDLFMDGEVELDGATGFVFGGIFCGGVLALIAGAIATRVPLVAYIIIGVVVSALVGKAAHWFAGGGD